METIKLDLIPGKKMPSLHASQYDDGRDYHIDLTENRVPYTLDGTETISLTVRKCDNTLVTMDIANTFADKSYIEFRTTEQMNACAGFNYGEITIEKNGTQISSLNFYLQVEGAPDEGGITSQSEINNLARQVHDIVVEELEDNGAEETGYDNTESGLEATNVQAAIDEVNTKIENIPSVDAYTKEQSDSFLADEYDATQTYAVGDYRIHEGGLYVCNTAISTAEDWNASHWTLTDVGSALEAITSNIPTKTSQLQNDSGFTQIDDSEASASKTYSSEKIEEVVDSAFRTVVTVSGSVANFETPVENAILSAGITLVETQESGTPTPSTPKLITTYSQAVISQADEDMTVQDTRTISLGAAYTKGTLAITDKGNGYASVKLTPERKAYDLSGLTWQVHNQGFYYADLPSDLKHFGAEELANIIAEKYQVQTAQWIYGHGTTVGYIAINGGKLWVTDSTTPSGLFVDDLAEPTEIDLSDISSIITLVGANNFYTDTNGNISVTYSVGLEDQIDMKADKSAVYDKEAVDKIIYRITEHALYVQATKATMTSSDTLNVGKKNNNKKNEIIEFIGYFDSFTSLSLGHGYNINNGNYAVIDSTNITIYVNNGSVVTTAAHGLTISDFIHVIIKQNDKCRVEVQIMTSTGNYTLASAVWTGCDGTVFAKVGTTMTNCICNAVYEDFVQKVFLFGDSYVSLDDAQRYPKYLVDNGYANLLIDGYGGRVSANAITSFNNLMELVTPDFVVWALGMNDPDSSAINASWLTNVQSVLSKCEEKGIVPILATIPNTPTRDNSYKNAWVRASGYRYVDFAKAVGAESAGSSWFTGMLYTDNVHPTSLGAKALYTRFIIDVPEVIR